jgi:lipopolysaccharide export LptBFGC system permease protein LptF
MARGEMKLNLSKLIFIVCISGVGFVGLNFIACNFMIPGSIISANVLGD